MKKLMKPHKGVLHLVVEREEEEDKDIGYLTSVPPPPSGESEFRTRILPVEKGITFWNNSANLCEGTWCTYTCIQVHHSVKKILKNNQPEIDFVWQLAS